MSKLSINLTKIDFMVFSKSNKFVIARVYINNHLVKLIYNVRFLGVLIDNHMTWKKRIHYVSNKLTTVSFLINKVSSILDDKSLKILYIYHCLTHILTIIVKYKETHIQQIFKCIYYKKE